MPCDLLWWQKCQCCEHAAVQPGVFVVGIDDSQPKILDLSPDRLAQVEEASSDLDVWKRRDDCRFGCRLKIKDAKPWVQIWCVHFEKAPQFLVCPPVFSCQKSIQAWEDMAVFNRMNGVQLKKQLWCYFERAVGHPVRVCSQKPQHFIGPKENDTFQPVFFFFIIFSVTCIVQENLTCVPPTRASLNCSGISMSSKFSGRGGKASSLFRFL